MPKTTKRKKSKNITSTIRWINASKELPAFQIPVLIVVGHRVTIGFIDWGLWCESDDILCRGAVTHWAHLPDAP